MELRAFGDRLRETRETRGLSLESAADATRIARRHLVALERSDLAALPAGPFAKGYIRAYAEFLGIDPRPILDAYRAEEQRRLDTPEAQSRMLEELTRLVEQRAGETGRSRRFAVGWRSVAVALVAAAALGTVVWLVSRARAPQPAVAASPRSPEAAAPEVGVAPETASRPGGPTGSDTGAAVGTQDSPSRVTDAPRRRAAVAPPQGREAAPRPGPDRPRVSGAAPRQEATAAPPQGREVAPRPLPEPAPPRVTEVAPPRDPEPGPPHATGAAPPRDAGTGPKPAEETAATREPEVASPGQPETTAPVESVQALAPAVAPVAPASPTVSGASAGIQVSHSGVGTGIRGRRLVGRADRFVEGTQVAFWTRVLGGRPGDVIRHVWFHEGEAVMRADLTIGGSHWRTYSRRLLSEGATGDWVVEARGPDGGVLARQEFLCIPDAR